MCYYQSKSWISRQAPFPLDVTVREVGQCMDKMMAYYMMNRMIPKDLTCMSDCNLPDNDKVIIQTSAVYIETTIFWFNFRIKFEFDTINCVGADIVGDTDPGNTTETVKDKYNKCYLNFRYKMWTKVSIILSIILAEKGLQLEKELIWIPLMTHFFTMQEIIVTSSLTFAMSQNCSSNQGTDWLAMNDSF